MSDLQTAYTALRAALISTASNTPSWAGRAYADQAPAPTASAPITRPYVIYSYSGGGDENALLQADPNLLIDVTCVADTVQAALAGDTEIRARLDDSGEQDIRRGMTGDAEWYIKTVTHEQRLHFVEQANNGATQIYHSGGRYRVIMERKT